MKAHARVSDRGAVVTVENPGSKGRFRLSQEMVAIIVVGIVLAAQMLLTTRSMVGEARADRAAWQAKSQKQRDAWEAESQEQRDARRRSDTTGVVHCGRCQGPAVAPRRQPTGRGNTDSLQVHVSGAPRYCAVPRRESIRYEATALDRASIPVMHAQGVVGARYAPRGSRDRARPSSAGSGAAVPQA